MPGFRETVEKALLDAKKNCDMLQTLSYHSFKKDNKYSSSSLPKDINTLIIEYAVDLELRGKSAEIKDNLKKYMAALIEMKKSMVEKNDRTAELINKIDSLAQKIDNFTDPSQPPPMQDRLMTLVKDYEKVCIELGQTKISFNAGTIVYYSALKFIAADGLSDIDVVELMINNKADVSSKDSNGSNLLMSVVGRGHLKIVNALLERNEIDINAPSNFGQTVVEIAIGSGRPESVDIFKALLAHGAKPAEKDRTFLIRLSKQDKIPAEKLKILTEFENKNKIKPN